MTPVSQYREAMARGIEVFGRGATVVEYGPRDRSPRTPALGAGAVLVAIMAVAALAAALIERSALFTWIALGASGAAVLAGLVAVVTGRGRIPGLVAMLAGALANPWVLSIVLTWASSFVE